VQGTLMVQAAIDRLNQDGPEPFPVILQHTLMHIIVSHHGSREFGCPVVPATPEAFVVHYLDNLDSKIALTFAEIDKDVNQTNWTNFLRAIESPLFKLRPNQ